MTDDIQSVPRFWALRRAVAFPFYVIALFLLLAGDLFGDLAAKISHED